MGRTKQVPEPKKYRGMSELDWLQGAAAGVVVMTSLAGIVLTMLTLPGTWVALAGAASVKFWRPELVPWWVLVTALALAVLAEAVEFFASAAGAAKGGAGKQGMMGAMIGSLVGAVAGAVVPPFPLGVILGAVLGAAAGTLVAERHADATWIRAGKAATGAALGRFVATVVKTGLAVVIAGLLSITVVVKAW
jgi:uncharacterized protein YqgC (DUF456 family)